MENNLLNTESWSKNVIIVDAECIDNTAFHLTVNFERMLERRIPKADFAHWLDCIALDGGIREGENNIQVILLHDKKSKQLNNFTPSNFEEELNQKAFKDHLGEFVISSFPYEEIVEKDALFTDITSTICNHANVKRVMIIPNHEKEALWNNLRMALNRVDDENKKITLFAMQPMPGGNFKQEILGYSLMSALGIKGSELKD